MSESDHDLQIRRIYTLMIRAFGLFALAIIAVILFRLLSMPPPTSAENSDYTYTYGDTDKQDTIKDTSESCANEHCSACCTSAENEEESRNKFIASKRDLNAQEGVWRASNLMAILTGFATIIGVAGIYLLKATLDATNSTLKVAQESNDEIMRSNVLQLKPYISVTFVWAGRIQDWDKENLTQSFEIYIDIENSGKTPASQIFVSVGAGSSIGWMRDGTTNSADFQSITPMSAQEKYINEAKSTIRLNGSWQTNERSDWPLDQSSPATGKFREWKCRSVTLRDLCIRYKDLECEGKRWHKIIRGSIDWAERDPSKTKIFRISLIDTEEDKDHEHYRENTPS